LLPRYIEYLLQYAKDHSLTIEAVALSEGPGSYTGLRIGTSTAKGLCYGLNVPLIPIPTLEILKHASGIIEGRLIPMIDARRMEVYTLINEEVKAIVVENEESLTSDSATVYFFGDGAEKCAKIFTKPNWHYIPDIVPEAQYMGTLAEQIIAKSQELRANEIAYYEPFYLKEFIAAPSHIKGLK
jgi:tRNA threonylcarbamoyladenosine biosynthesis protein TsaB